MRDEALVGSDEASRILGIHRATFLRWVADGLIAPVHETPGIRGAKVFRRADVEQLAREKAEASA